MKKEIEVFVNCKFNSGYQIGNQGTVLSTCGRSSLFNGAKPLKGTVKPDGYKMYFLISDEYPNGKWNYAHRLVAQHFIENTDNKPDVNHQDGNKCNNSVDNLNWTTKSENILHSYRVLNRTPPVGMTGKTHSAKIRQTMSKKKLGSNHPKFTGYYIVNGEKYGSAGEANRATGMCIKSIWRWCKSNKNNCSFEPI